VKVGALFHVLQQVTKKRAYQSFDTPSFLVRPASKKLRV